jgi:hypothetical protein
LRAAAVGDELTGSGTPLGKATLLGRVQKFLSIDCASRMGDALGTSGKKATCLRYANTVTCRTWALHRCAPRTEGLTYPAYSSNFNYDHTYKSDIKAPASTQRYHVGAGDTPLSSSPRYTRYSSTLARFLGFHPPLRQDGWAAWSNALATLKPISVLPDRRSNALGGCLTA